jgi:peptidyl-prolyl cis-trans isomerase C
MLRTIRRLVLLLAAACLTVGRTPAAEPPQTNTADPVQPSASADDTLVAKGKGIAITRGELEKEAEAAKAQMKLRSRPAIPDQNHAAEQQVLEQLINIQLLMAKATPVDKAAGKAAAEKRYAASIAKVGSEEGFDEQLKLLGTTRKELLDKWTLALTGEAVVKRELKINITDQETRKFYEDNPSQFAVPESVRASHIFFNIMDPKTGKPLSDAEKAAKYKEAEALLKRARAGEDFAKLAREYSEDPVSKARGGEYTFAHGQMVPEVEAAAFAMNTNQIGDIVTSAYGYHIIKVLEKIPAHKIDFATAAPDIKNELAQQVIQQQFPDYIERLRKEAGVEILDEDLKPKTLEAPPEGMPTAPTRRPG